MTAQRDTAQRSEIRKDERLRELAAELGSVNAKNKGLEGELQRVKDLVEQQKEGISHLNHELTRKEEDMQKILYEQETANNSKIRELMATIEEKEQAIATLTTENQKLETSLAEAAKTEIFLSEELQRFKYGIKPGEEEGEQLQLFPTPEEQPSVISNQSPVISEELEVISEEQPPAVNSEGREVGRGELIEYIRQNFPKAKINPQNITDAINGKSKRMPEFESTYGFKHIGKKAGQHRFIILSQG